MPPKPSTTCTNLLCKSCCLRYQTEYPGSGVCKTHKPESSRAPASSSNVISVDPTSTQAVARGRPLKEIHYQRREEVEQLFAERMKTVVHRKQYEDDQKKQADVCYWKEDGRAVPFSVFLSTFPWFRLDDIPNKMKTLVGDTVELFDASAATWKITSLSFTRTGCKIAY
ncbi:hypothetical protein PQX77_021349 [Marasmius sp. AFHP31]|nr:hypothetical protein PQX77_021349 [Marasmius sp. AFHP31]